nr:MAG TPA: hypothetical protein [Caudoviricetes sp.]
MSGFRTLIKIPQLYHNPNLCQTKKPQHNAEASTTTTMMSELWSVGR